MQNAEAPTPAWNRQEAIRRLGNDPEIATSIFHTLVQGLDSQLLGMIEALKASNWAAIELSAHRLLGSSRICATPRLERLAFALEYCAKTRDILATPDLLAEIQQEADRLREVASQVPESTS